MPSESRNPDFDFEDQLQNVHDAIDSEDFDTANHALEDIFAHVTKLASENPTMAMSLTVAAKKLEAEGKWAAAKGVYNRILATPGLDVLAETQTHENLGVLAQLLSRHSESVDHARQATSAARRSEITILLSGCLLREARCLIRCDQIDEARSRLEEATAILSDERMYDQLRASALTSRANCLIKSGGELTKAEQDLEDARQLLAPSAEMAIAAGVQGNMAVWWSIKANLASARNQKTEAVKSWRKAVEITRHILSLSHVANVNANSTLSHMLEGLSQALLADNRNEEAAAVAEEKRTILRDLKLPDIEPRKP